MTIYLSDIASIITSVGIVGTLILGVVNLKTSKQIQTQSQQYAFSRDEYDKNKERFLKLMSEYLALLNAHSISTGECLSHYTHESNDEIAKYFHKIETLYCQIELIVNPENSCCPSFSSVLDRSRNISEKICDNSKNVNLYTGMLKTAEEDPEGLLARYYALLSNSAEIGSKSFNETFNSIVLKKDSCIRELFEFIEQLPVCKNELVEISRQYLECEKSTVIGGHPK
ncbi:MAG: hypothetical protein SNI70_03665 [Rikenellaceae bacterium]